METVDSVWYTKLGVEESLNLFAIRQVGFAGNGVFGALGDFGLNNVGKDKVEIGGFLIDEKVV